MKNLENEFLDEKVQKVIVPNLKDIVNDEYINNYASAITNGENYLEPLRKRIEDKIENIHLGKLTPELFNNQRIYEAYDNLSNPYKRIIFGIYMSSFINKYVREIKPNLISIAPLKPIDYLLYRFSEANAYILGKTGDFLGYNAIKSEIHAEEAGSFAGKNMHGTKLELRDGGDNVAAGAIDSNVFALDLGDFAGRNMSYSSISVFKAGEYAAIEAEDCSFYAKSVGNFPGYKARHCQLFIFDLGESKIDHSVFNGRNEVYLGRESYKKYIQNHPQNKEKISMWDEDDYKKWEERFDKERNWTSTLWFLRS